jgi:hypothetical protein
MRRCRTRPPSPAVHLSPLPLVTPGVCFCVCRFPCRLTAYPSQRPSSHNTPCLARAPPTRPNTHHHTPHHVPHARPVCRRRRGGMLPPMCRGVRSVGQELPAVSLRLPSMLHCSARATTSSRRTDTRQICQFCYNNIKTTMNGLCPACRRPYDDSTIEWKTISSEEWVPYTSRPEHV